MPLKMTRFPPRAKPQPPFFVERRAKVGHLRGDRRAKVGHLLIRLTSPPIATSEVFRGADCGDDCPGATGAGEREERPGDCAGASFVWGHGDQVPPVWRDRGEVRAPSPTLSATRAVPGRSGRVAGAQWSPACTGSAGQAAA